MPGDAILFHNYLGCSLEVRAIVWDDLRGDSVTTDDVLSDELFHFLGIQSFERLCFDPFGKIVYGHLYEHMSNVFFWRYLPDNVYPLGGERPWSRHVVQLPRRELLGFDIDLALVAATHIVVAVALQGRPVVPLSDNIAS